MQDNFDDIMSKRSDADLLLIISGPEEDYQPAALDAAKKEFAKRNLSVSHIEIVKREIAQEEKEKAGRANEPLDTGWKALSFIVPGLIFIIISGAFRSDGYDRKAKDLVRWTLYGLGFYIGSIVLLSILDFFKRII